LGRVYEDKIGLFAPIQLGKQVAGKKYPQLGATLMAPNAVATLH